MKTRLPVLILTLALFALAGCSDREPIDTPNFGPPPIVLGRSREALAQRWGSPAIGDTVLLYPSEPPPSIYTRENLVAHVWFNADRAVEIHYYLTSGTWSPKQIEACLATVGTKWSLQFPNCWNSAEGNHAFLYSPSDSAGSIMPARTRFIVREASRLADQKRQAEQIAPF